MNASLSKTAKIGTAGDRRTLELLPSLDAPSERIRGQASKGCPELRKGWDQKPVEVKRKTQAGAGSYRCRPGWEGRRCGKTGGNFSVGATEEQGVSSSRAETAKMQALVI